MTDRSSPSRFFTTQWTRVLSARGESGEAREALSDLCGDYYAPVVAFLAKDGRTAEDARETAHEFFEYLLEGNRLEGLEREKGRFRSYLLGALKHFIGHERERRGRIRHGGGAAHLSLEAENDDASPAIALVLADEGALTPDACFDRQWALTVLSRALESLGERSRSDGKGELFTRLKPWLLGEAAHGEQQAVASELGMSTSAVKVAVHRLRQQFRRAVREEVGRTLNDPQAVEEELEALNRALG